MSDWLDQLSAAQLALVVCSFFIAITWLGILLVHPVMRRVLHRDEPSNELVIHVAGTFGLVYAVLLGLLTVATFQNTKDVEDGISHEASALSAIYHSADGYPDPQRGELKAELRDYTHYVIEKDWPAHRRGGVLEGGEHRLQVIRSTLLSQEPANKTQELLQSEVLRYLDQMMVAREQRLAAVTATIPPVLWYVVAIGAFLMIAFLWMLYIKLVPHIIFGGITAFFLGMMIFLIYAMDHPLQGAVSVQPDPFRSVYDLVMKWDEATPAHANEAAFVSLGTGEMNEVYYPVGKAICDVVNEDLTAHGVRCSPETTPGSVYNIDALRSGELDFAIIQSDLLSAAYNGQAAWVGRPFPGLRSVMPLFPELVTVMARADSSIRDLADLAGRRVNVGERDSGTRATWDAIQASLGWHGSKQVHPIELRTQTSVSALCSGVVDASLMIVGHPSPAVTAQRAACPVNFVAIGGPAIDQLIHDHPYYKRETIGAADGLAVAVPTFGVRAALVTSASADPRVVAVIVRALLSHLSELRTMNPALAGLTTDETIKGGLGAPLHPGAAMVYTGLVQRD